jgi:hypothetical protein
MGEFVSLEVTEGVGTIRLDRPPANAIDPRVSGELLDAAAEATEREDVGALVVWGGPRIFAAGADIKVMAGFGPDEARALQPFLGDACDAIERIPKVVIAAVNGYALGGGCELALGCDFRADAAEKAASSAGMEKDYITRTQKQYESYYQRVLNTQMWTLGIMGLILTGVFVLVARFSLKMIDEQTKAATAGATVQMRNEYARALAKEVQKLWDSNAADVKKLKETLTAQFAELEQNLKDRSDFQMQFVQALAEGLDERQGRVDHSAQRYWSHLRTAMAKKRKLTRHDVTPLKRYSGLYL